MRNTVKHRHVAYRVLHQYSDDEESLSESFEPGETEVSAERYQREHGASTSTASDPSFDVAYEEEKLKYPKSVFFIISNEFCERFSYYGMRTILSLYLVFVLQYSEPDAKVIYHLFTMFVYFFPIFGAIIADSWLGKFKTIFYVSCIYAVGNVVLALSSIGPLQLPQREIAILGLLLIAVGTGGIKPCVSAFGGDQFKLPQQSMQLAKFFSLFYFSINAGSLISTLLTPILRENVKCFGADSCFPLAFGIPGILMIISLIIFVAGRPLYNVKKPEGNILVKVSKCIGHAVSQKISNKSSTKKEHWLDHAEDKYDPGLIADIKATLKVLLLYVPLPFFWALFDQQGTGWTFQATRMKGDIGFAEILPDQMQVVNPLLILAFIPLFDQVLYPLLAKCNLLRKPLQRLAFGMILAAIAFCISAILELQLEKTYPILPQKGEAQIRIYNTVPCEFDLTCGPLNSLKLEQYQMYQERHFKISGAANYPCSITPGNVCGLKQPIPFELKISEMDMVGLVIKYNDKNTFVSVEQYMDDVKKASNGYPLVRTIVNTKNGEILPVYYKGKDGSHKVEINTVNFTALEKITPDTYEIYVNNTKIGNTTLKKFEIGAVYTNLIDFTNEKPEVRQFVITEPNSIHILWLIPQYIVITMGEIMFSVTGLEFSYSQAPTSMKSVMQAGWLLTTAIGNLLVVVIEEMGHFSNQAYSYFLYAGLMALDMIIFALLAMRYKYVKKEESVEEEDEQETNIDEKKANGIDNKAYNDEKY